MAGALPAICLSGAMMPDIRTTATRIVYENRWMRVREDAIVRQDGSPGIYGVVEKSDFAIIAPVEKGMIHLS
jgi:ADP-ribose pyrophosphatase